MTERPSHCRGCKEPMRPGKAPLADYPGTVAHHGHGYCTSCNTDHQHDITEAKKRNDPLPPEVLERMKVEHRATYDRIMRRRNDWIPAGGWRTSKGLTHG